jgi:hypothetical protein
LLPLHIFTTDRIPEIDVLGRDKHVNGAYSPLDLSHLSAGDHAFGHPGSAQGSRKGNAKDDNSCSFHDGLAPEAPASRRFLTLTAKSQRQVNGRANLAGETLVARPFPHE